MPIPLKVVGPEAKPGGAGCLSMALVLALAGGLAWAWGSGRTLEFEGPGVLVLVWGLLLAVAAWVGFGFSSAPLEYEANPEEEELGRLDYLGTFGREYWMSLLMWSAPLLGLAILPSEALKAAEGGVATLEAPAALSAMALTFGLFAFYGNMLNLWCPFRVSEEGVRMEPAYFLEWENIHHAGVEEGAFVFFHKAQPGLPFGGVRLESAEARNRLLNLLNEHKIPQGPARSTLLGLVKIGSILGLVVTTALGWQLYASLGWDPRMVMIQVFAAGIGETLLLERLRGVRHITKSKPVMIKPENRDKDL